MTYYLVLYNKKYFKENTIDQILKILKKVSRPKKTGLIFIQTNLPEGKYFEFIKLP